MFIREVIHAIDSLKLKDTDRRKVYFRNAIRMPAAGPAGGAGGRDAGPRGRAGGARLSRHRAKAGHHPLPAHHLAAGRAGAGSGRGQAGRRLMCGIAGIARAEPRGVGCRRNSATGVANGAVGHARWRRRTRRRR